MNGVIGGFTDDHLNTGPVFRWSIIQMIPIAWSFFKCKLNLFNGLGKFYGLAGPLCSPFRA